MALKNKIVLITGASSGIGEACARQFAEAGAKLLLCARRLELLDQLAAQLRVEYQVDIHTLALDVRDQQQVQMVLRGLPTDWQAIDILVNNAGLAAGLDTVQAGHVEDWDAMLDTNIKGLLYVTQTIVAGMVERQSGHVINIGSVAGRYVYPKGVVYCATKHAVRAITAGLRQELFNKNIKVSSVDPGAVETNFSLVRFKGDKARAAAVYQDMQPLVAADIADAVFYCASRPPHVNIDEMLVMPADQAVATSFVKKNST